MSKLNQVIAIEKGVKSRAYSELNDAQRVCEKPDLFNGAVRTYDKRDADGEDLPPERKLVQQRVRNVLDSVRRGQSELWDVTTQKDVANNKANADIVVDGIVILHHVPVTTLLFLEKQLTDMRTLISKLPELDPAENWTYDKNSGLERSDETRANRTKKTQKALVMLQPTDKHPGQAQVIVDDVVVGSYALVRHSGAIGRPVKDAMLRRADKLIVAVKEAREKANDIDAGDRPNIGAPIFEFLFGE